MEINSFWLEGGKRENYSRLEGLGRRTGKFFQVGIFFPCSFAVFFFIFRTFSY
jgi:hypothetical protein|nr:MAG TPA: hypothetical protein [Bacteriophage sp.]